MPVWTRVPVLAITGQVPTSVIATDAFQESDVVGVMMPLTKQTYMPLSVDDIETTIHEAMYVASIRPRRTGGGGHPQGCPNPGDGQRCYRFDPDPTSRICPAFLFTVGGSGAR
jgi:acetolactate synthase-1/2/3 large subunit